MNIKYLCFAPLLLALGCEDAAGDEKVLPQVPANNQKPDAPLDVPLPPPPRVRPDPTTTGARTASSASKTASTTTATTTTTGTTKTTSTAGTAATSNEVTHEVLIKKQLDEGKPEMAIETFFQMINGNRVEQLKNLFKAIPDEQKTLLLNGKSELDSEQINILHQAVVCKSPEMIELLLQYSKSLKVDLNVDLGNGPPVYKAIFTNKYINILKKFYEADNDIFNKVDKKGSTAISYCEFTSSLLTHGGCRDEVIQYMLPRITKQTFETCYIHDGNKKNILQHVISNNLFNKEYDNRLSTYILYSNKFNLNASCDGRSAIHEFFRGFYKHNDNKMTAEQRYYYDGNNGEVQYEKVFDKLIAALSKEQLGVEYNGSTILSNSVAFLDVERVKKLLKKGVDCKGMAQIPLTFIYPTNEVYSGLEEARKEQIKNYFGLVMDNNFGFYRDLAGNATWAQKFAHEQVLRGITEERRLDIFNQLLNCTDANAYPVLFSLAARHHEPKFLEALSKKMPFIVKNKNESKVNIAVYEAIKPVLVSGPELELQKSKDLIKDPFERRMLEAFTKRVMKTLETLKELKLPKEDFTKNIIGKDAQGNELSYAGTDKATTTWYFDDVRKKLLELAR